MAEFKDHFSGVSGDYARFRPHYPAALFGWLVRQCAGHELAWDCATGSGQAAVALAEHFAHVIASDAAAAQVAQATPHPKVEYRVAPAEASGLADASVDLVTVAQALHWFDIPRFFAEVVRVLKPGGVLAIWSYGSGGVDFEPADAVFRDFSERVVGPYWPPERKFVESGYAGLALPVPELPAATFPLEVNWTLGQLVGYTASWSAVARYRQERGEDPVLAFHARLAAAWGEPTTRRNFRWPLTLRAGRKP